MGLTPQPEDDQKRDQPDGNGQCSDPIHAGGGIKTTHVQLPLGSRRQRAVKRPAGADPATGLAKLAALGELRRAAGRLLVAGTRVRGLLLRAKHLFVAAMVAGCGMPGSTRAGSRSRRGRRRYRNGKIAALKACT